jgi:polyphenol oxidase
VTRHPSWLAPDWAVEGVGALMTTRHGGVSAVPFDAMNLHEGGGDGAVAVARNRELLAAAVGGVPIYLRQVHGKRVVRLAGDAPQLALSRFEADASVTTQPGLVCCVQVADCLPVLFAAPGGRGVGAAHAGWRGLASGVLEATLEALCDSAKCSPAEVQCWLGACIGPGCFEVGADVLQAFGSPVDCPHPGFTPVREGKWLADLPFLARQRLRGAGVGSVHGGTWCTFRQPQDFFSFRRDRVTGRMVAAVWIDESA